MGVRWIPKPKIQAMIACKNCGWMVGWFAVGIDGLSMVGFIASRSDGWFVCWYRSFGRIYGRWLACRLNCLLSSLSVGWTIRPACYIQPITDWPANHPSIYLRSVPEFPESKVRRLPVFVWLFGCGGATWPMLVNRWPSLECISSSLSRGYTIPPWLLILG